MNLHEVWENIAKELPKLEWKRDALFPKTTHILSGSCMTTNHR